MKGGLLLFFVALSSVIHSTSATPICSRGKEWQECGTSCPLSCDNYGTTVHCTLRCVPGCFCRQGTVEFNGVCILPSECPGDITVGYERTVYNTTEGQGMVELCAVLTSHPGGAPRPFSVLATTRNGTAVAGTDYIRVAGEELVFNYDDTRVCHTIHILQDSMSEHGPNEDFFLDLTYVSGVQPIIIAQPNAQVVIDDSGEPESRCPQGKEWQDCGIACPFTCGNYNTTVHCRLQCLPGCFCPWGTVENSNGDCVHPSQCPARCPHLTDPTNGVVGTTNNTEGSTVTYSCNNGFKLSGAQTRSCQINGTWSGDAPICELTMCPPLTAPSNGRVMVSGLIPGSAAQYSCDQGYERHGVRIRWCQSDETWSDVPPTCDTIMCIPLTPPAHGQVVVSGLTPGSTAQYSCSQGYERNGVQIRMCQSDGTWSGARPTCDRIMCPSLTAPTNGHVVVSDLIPGSTAQYSCNQGYRRNGVQIRMCRSDGTWNSVPPICDPQGNNLCFSSTACGGSLVSGPTTFKDCCVGTDEGLSWRNGGGSCTDCIVHGFTNVEIQREEGQVTSGQFKFFVKGESPGTTPADILLGTITDVPDTARVVSDYIFGDADVDLEFGVTDSGVTWRLIVQDDSIALEYDTLNLEFTSAIPGSNEDFEDANPPQFIRSSMRVHIVDTDDLTITYNHREYGVDESVGEFTSIMLRFSETQDDFTVEFTPASVDESITVYKLSQLLDLDRFEDETQKATAGDDFVTTTFSHSVTGGSRVLTIRPVPIRDDDINENEQFFVLVTKLLGRAADSACFQVVTGDPCSTVGGVVLRIHDDDAMEIGFDARRTVVRENQFPSFSRYPIFLNIISNRRSELDFVVTAIEGQSTATVTESTELMDDWDFAFGYRDRSGFIIIENTLLRNNTELSQTITMVNNDVIVEETENVTIVISLRVIQNVREKPRCLTDDENPANYFCSNTVSIIDEDEPLEVGFERTLYEVDEDVGQVEICVNLTKPASDIFHNVVGVEVFEHNTIKTNEHIPVGAAIADGDPPDVDYDRERFGRNQLRGLRITETNRRICYNQIIFDDLRLEPTEYAGLTLQVRDSVTTIRTDVAIEHTTFRIIDNDVTRVGFEQTFYRVAETVETVEICAEVFEPATDCPIEFAFDVTIETRDGTARDPGDYRRLSTQLSFLTCETRKCINMAIVNDNIAESPELFTARLGRTRALDPRITIDPISTTVEISDA